MRSHWSRVRASTNMTSILIKRGNLDREGLGNMKAVMKVMGLYTKQCQRCPENQEPGKKHGTHSPSQSSGVDPEC